MNWEAIGAIGEIVGAAAVFASLVYLAMQIKTQNNESKIASVNEILTTHRDVTSMVVLPENAELILKSISEPSMLTKSELIQINAFNMLVFRNFENAFYQTSRGRLDNHIWMGLKGELDDYIQTEIAKGTWQRRKHQFGTEFQDFMNSSYKLD